MSPHSPEMYEVLEMSVSTTGSQEDIHGKPVVSTNEAANYSVVGPSASEILLGRNAENSAEMISVGMPSTAEDLSTKGKDLFFKTANVII